MIKVITIRDVIRKAPAEFLEAQGCFNQDEPTFWKPTHSRRQILAELAALDVETCTPADLARVIGNDSRSRLLCSECETPQEAVVHIGDEPDYEARWVQICAECAAKALAAIS